MNHFWHATIIPAILLATGAAAQGYPSKPIRLVATSTPGSPVDIYARAISDHLAKSLGQPVVVENRAGAGGTLAAAYVLSAEPDGHVTMVNTSAQVVAPFVYTGLPFDLLRDFAGIGPIAVLPNVLIVAPQRGWKNVQDLIAAARAKPGGYTYGTGGSGTGTHMSAERFRLAAAITAVQVPYKGSPEILVEIVPGRIDWAFVPLSTVIGQIKEGKIQALALSAERRSEQLPELPTLTDAGMKNADFPFWVGMFVSSKVPRPVVRRLYEDTLKAMQNAEVRDRLTKLGAEIVLMTPEAFDAYVKAQAEVAAVIVKEAKIKAN
ncbi:MAG TPA: tripartite tricarboxylate transporter substrate-binding protein [Burkholderiales bacterium]|nr:tripartite tricarboxylate transporter substrate-binding protein [Burkholderiales bacterium]